MAINHKKIKVWVSDHNIILNPYFTETLRGYAIPYGKSII